MHGYVYLQILLTASAVCAKQLHVLSPLTLRSSAEASALVAEAGSATAAGTGLAARNPPWNVALHEALLHVVREARYGCDLLLAAVGRTIASHKAAGADAITAAAAVGNSIEDLITRSCRAVMTLYHMALQWMMQSGHAAANRSAITDLADMVLAALVQPVGPEPSVPSSSGASLKSNTSSGNGTAAGGATPNGSGVQYLAGQHIAQQLLQGCVAIHSAALAATPPELLVALLQQCSQALHLGGPMGLSGAAGLDQTSSSLQSGAMQLGMLQSVPSVGMSSAVASMAAAGWGQELRGMQASEADLAGLPGFTGVSNGICAFSSMRRGFMGRPGPALPKRLETQTSSASTHDGRKIIPSLRDTYQRNRLQSLRAGDRGQSSAPWATSTIPAGVGAGAMDGVVHEPEGDEEAGGLMGGLPSQEGCGGPGAGSVLRGPWQDVWQASAWLLYSLHHAIEPHGFILNIHVDMYTSN